MLRKYATLQVLEAYEVPADASRRALRKAAHRVTFDYEPRPGYLYVRSRMISSRCNDNFDEFPAEEIKVAYRTFVGKPVFVNHHNEDHRRARGVIIDAALHEDRNPDGSPDTWVEGLMEVDAKTFPRLAKAILAGEVDRTSMGCDVQLSVCSACGNKARNPAEYCHHIPAMKGQRIFRVNASTGRREGHLVREICHGLSFFENSLLVEEPADPTAFFLGVDDRGLKMTSRLNPQDLLHQRPGRTNRRTEVFLDHKISSMAGGYSPLSEDGWDIERMQARAAAGPKYPDPADHPFFKDNPSSPDHIVNAWHEATPGQKAQGRRWYSDAHEVAKAIGRGDAALGAGVLAAYSPKAAWPSNLFNASRSLQEGRALGKGEGDSIMGMHQRLAQKMIDGEHHSKVLKSPKISDFAHLIEHGGDEDPEKKTRVVVDRHAMSVATGKRMTTKDLEDAPLGSRHYYEHVANHYRQAAATISEHEGERVHPHQVQAVTWLVQQHRNIAHDLEHGGAGGKGRQSRDRNVWKRWTTEAPHHLPNMDPENIHVKDPHVSRRKRAVSDEEIWKGLDLPKAEDTHREVTRQKGKDLADALMAPMYEPYGGEENYHLHQANEGMMALKRRYEGGSGKFGFDHEDDGGDPYYEIKHPSGWTIRHYSDGPHAEIRHRATPDESHEVFDIGDPNGPKGMGEWEHPPETFGHKDLKALLDHWHSGPEEETGGAREYLEGQYGDPRIKRWKRIHGMRKGAPFAGYEDFEDCAEQNSDKDDPDAYCGEIKHRTEDKKKATRKEAVPQGIRFHFLHANDGPDMEHKIRATMPVGKGRKQVGYMTWHPTNGMVGMIQTDPNYRRQGIANALWDRAHELAAERGLTPPTHSDVRSPMGMGWVQGEEGRDMAQPLQGQERLFDRPEGNATEIESAPRPTYTDMADHLAHEHGLGESWVQQAREHGGDLQVIHDNNHKFLDSDKFHVHGALNDVVAPPEVDTLRDEECPVCGDAEVYDGERCPICGFIAPPSMFRDPDLEMAKQVDLRGNQVQPGSELPGGGGLVDPSQLGPGGTGEAAEEQLQHPDQLGPNGEMAAQPGTPEDGIPDLFCPACGYAVDAGQPMSQPENDPNAPAAEGPEEGMPCPNCGQATLLSQGDMAQLGEMGQMAAGPEGQQEEGDELVSPDELPEGQEGDEEGPDDGSVPPEQGGPPEDDQGGPGAEEDDSDSEEDGDSEDQTAVDDDDDPTKKRDKNSKQGASMSRAVEAAMVAQQTVIEGLTRKVSALEAQNEFLAKLAGVEEQFAAIKRQADINNPAAPIPDPPEEQAPESTEEALAPAANDNVQSPGETPGSVAHVPATQTDVPMQPGVTLPTTPANQLIDVTAPVAGTNTGEVPLEQRRIETDVRIGEDPLRASGPGVGGLGNDGTAFPWTMSSKDGQALAANRTMASLRLARLQIQAGLATGDEFAIATTIEKNAKMSDEVIANSIQTLEALAARAAKQARPAGLVPRAASGNRSAPSMASLAPATAAYSEDGADEDLFLNV